MKSVVISEFTWHGGAALIDERSAQLIDERSAQLKVGDKVFTYYLGASQRLATPWKVLQSITPSAGGNIEIVLSDTILYSVGAHIANSLSHLPGIERIFIRKDNDFFRVWTVIADMDLRTEDQIYAAELAFMDRFRDIPLDFSVIFRQGKDPGTLLPAGAHEVYAA